MPESALWALIVGLILLALGLTLKNTELRHTIKRLRDELSTARSEISPLDEKQQKQIQDIERDYQARIKKLSDIILHLQSSTKQDVSQKQEQPLDEHKIGILKLLFYHEKLATESVATFSHLQLQTAQYHLVELAKLGMVSSQRFPITSHGIYPSLQRFSAWVLMQPGRKYLIENNLVEA